MNFKGPQASRRGATDGSLDAIRAVVGEVPGITERTEYVSRPRVRHERLRRMLLGVSGSVAASLMPNVALWLRQHVDLESIDVILSATASTMVSARALGAITHGRVIVDAPSEHLSSEPLHITLTKNADLFLIMPATANVIGKAANGIADDLITSCVMAAPCSVVFAPSMSAVMLSKPVVQRNVVMLRRDGYHVIEPVAGYAVSAGVTEVGAAPDIADVFARVMEIVHSEPRSRRAIE